MSLFEELKRRNVFRVGIAYAVVAWLMLQVADVMIDNIGAPDWLFGSILLVLAIGFPVVLVFAWAFELTPEGIKRESDVDRRHSITPRTGRKLDRAIIIVLALALAWFAWDKFSPGSAPQSVGEPALADASQSEKDSKDDPENDVDSQSQASRDQSIAVLPFVNLSANQDNEYFSDGLSEELLNLLARVDGLKVAARTSSFKFKDSDADIGEIGARLNVGTVLEGSVRRAGDQVRITAQLIKVNDGFNLWSQTYDRELDNIFAVQDEIANAIVDALRLPLLGEDQQTVAAVQSASFEAYDLYLLGKHHARAITGEGFEKAIDYLSRAVELDPAFVPGWSELASAYLLAADFGGRDMNESLPLAQAAIDRALALDPRSADALTAQGLLLNYAGSGSESAAFYERALAADPDQVGALIRLAQTLANDDPERALALAERALALDPLADLTRSITIVATRAARDRASAKRRFDAFLAEDPDNASLIETWANVERFSGNLADAIQGYRRVWDLRPGDTFPAFQIALCYLDLGQGVLAERWAHRARARGADTIWTLRADRTLQWYRGEWETLLLEMTDLSQTPLGGNSDIVAGIGDVLLQLGRADEAEARYREALDMLDVDQASPPGDTEAELLLHIASVSPEGPERERLLARSRERLAHLRSLSEDRWQTTRLAASIAALQGDRDTLFTELERSVDLGYRGAWRLERSLLLRDWRDDPRFREIIGRLNRISREQLAQLEAAGPDPDPTRDTSS